MFSSDDTIVAVATPGGRGGIAVARVSGPRAHVIAAALCGRASSFQPRRATRVRLGATAVPDDALITYFPAPASYTGEDVVEVSVHGSPHVVSALIDRAVELGARLARPGEFTLRAFVNGKMDLLQAEAVNDLVEAVSPAQAQSAVDQLEGALSGAVGAAVTMLRELQLRLEASIDFPDDGYHFIDRAEVGVALDASRAALARLLDTGSRGQVIRDGLRVVIAGSPNVGKSSVFNALVGSERAIVSAWPGTTRDLVSERVVVGAGHVLLVDTAGVRAGGDVVEAEGIRRAEDAVRQADLALVVLDRSVPLSDADRAVLTRTAGAPRIVVGNKTDLVPAWDTIAVAERVVCVSATSGAGMPALVAELAAKLTPGSHAPRDVLVTNRRHLAALGEAWRHVDHACRAFADAGGEIPEEFIAADVQQALASLEELTGARIPEDVLREIFARFCIGK